MLTQLSLNDYERTRPLFGDLPGCHLCIDATLDGVNPGHVWVDDAAQPRSVFLTGVEGSFLAGDPDNAAFNAALRDLIIATLFGAWKYRALSISVTPAGWADRLPEIVPWPPVPNPRRHYVCTALAIDWRARVPDGFEVRRLDQALFDTPGMQIPGHVGDWMRWNWGSEAAFLEHAFGFGTCRDHRLVSWSLVDCTSGSRCEIGIQTEPEYRRRGLATITAAAAVDHALAHGYTEVGWQCNDYNLGSIGTAENVGFRHVHDYTHYDCMATEALYLGEIAFHHNRKGEYHQEADVLRRACALPDAPAWLLFDAGCACARLGDHEAALGYLQQAVGAGFTHRDAFRHAAALQPLHATAGWQALLAHLDEKGEAP